MTVNQGFPDGYAFSRPGTGERRTEGDIRNEKQKTAITELYKHLPANMIQGTPVLYDEEGLPLVDDDYYNNQQNSLEEQLRYTVEKPAVRQAQHQAQPQREVDPNRFFAPTPQRQRQAPPPAQQQQQQQQAQQQAQRPVAQQVAQDPFSTGSTAYHPVIKKMLNVFGIKKNSRHDLEVSNEHTGDKIVYTMTLINEELQSWAVVEGRQRMAKDDAGATYFELLFICCAVVAIDGVSLWQAFNIAPLEDERDILANDPLEMSFRLRRHSAKALAELMWRDVIPFGDKLVDFYKEKVLGNKVQSSLDKELENKVRYVCPLDGCDNYEFFTPELDASGNETKFYCKYHGVDMIKTIDLLKELNIPLE